MNRFIKHVIFPLISLGAVITLANQTYAIPHPVADAAALKIAKTHAHAKPVIDPNHPVAQAATSPASPTGTPNSRQFRRTHGVGMNRGGVGVNYNYRR